eukprot:EG_transcript_45451
MASLARPPSHTPRQLAPHQSCVTSPTARDRGSRQAPMDLSGRRFRRPSPPVREAGVRGSYPGGIVEMLAPPDVAVAHAYLERLAQRFRAGQGIVMHCRAGVGRAGMMAAMFLLLTGEADNATQAIALVRQRR